jgi:mRNA interferase RelE/StbE
MNYHVQLSDGALKELRKIDRHQAHVILSWIEKHLEDCADPRLHGKALVGDKRGYWRYRIGAYRLIADIQDKVVRIEIIHIAHRREIYERNRETIQEIFAGYDGGFFQSEELDWGGPQGNEVW